MRQLLLLVGVVVSALSFASAQDVELHSLGADLWERRVEDAASGISNMPMCQRMARSSSCLSGRNQWLTTHDFSPCPKGKLSFTS